MTDGEITILATSLVGAAGTLANLWFTDAKTRRVSDDLVRAREQDRLDREQIAKELMSAQRHELEMARLKVEAAATEVKHQLAISNQAASAQRELMIQSVEEQRIKMNENTELTRQGAQRAEQAYNEANTVNQKLEKIGLENVAQQAKRKEQDEKIESSVIKTEEQVGEVHEVIVKPKQH